MTAGDVAQEQESVQTVADAAPVAGPRWVRPAGAEPAWEGLPVSYEDVEAARETCGASRRSRRCSCRAR